MFKPFWPVLNCTVQLGMQLHMNFTLHSVPIFKTKMGTKSVPEKSEHFYTLTRPSAREDITEFCRRGVFKTLPSLFNGDVQSWFKMRFLDLSDRQLTNSMQQSPS